MNFYRKIFVILFLISGSAMALERDCKSRVAHAVAYYRLPISRYLWERYDVMGQDEIGFLLSNGRRRCIATCGSTRSIVCAGKTYRF